METQALSPGGGLGPEGGSVPRRTQRAIGASPAGHASVHVKPGLKATLGATWGLP